MLAPLVERYPEPVITEDLLFDESGAADGKMTVIAGVSSLKEVAPLGGSHELLQKLWGQFMLTASPVDIEAAWSRGEVLAGSGKYR